MHIAEVGVFDANAAALDIQTSDLMEAAGQALATEVSRIAEGLDGAEHREIWVLCGPGNNGGDGFVIARHLSQLGANITVFLAGTFSDLKGDAKGLLMPRVY